MSEKRTNIQNMSLDDSIYLINECIERLGLVSQAEYVKITGYKYSRQNLVEDLKKGKIKSIKIGRIRFPIINS